MSYRSADRNDDALLTDARRIRAVIFDLDGTLVDTVPLHVKSWIETCKRLGLPMPAPEHVITLMGSRHWILRGNYAAMKTLKKDYKLRMRFTYHY
ncbi:HAD hydrolase-like protein [Vulcanisaeta souniana]|uniref:HAD hydrolase-like protein n=1 Tax=Vulcanisaeta souniana TaxID=164452 RepID=UPI0006D14F1D|nr:HAD hydrolase-like protein [Vulcanisaeta souniana]